MLTLRFAAAALLVSLAAPALAQLRNHSVSLESGVSAPLGTSTGARGALALAATAWLDGAAEGLVRVGLAAVPQTGGRGSAAAITGTAGIRMSLLPDPLRPQLGIELGWARLDGPGGPADRVAFGVTAGLEWFPARDVSVAARAAVRGVGSALALEVVFGAATYF